VVIVSGTGQTLDRPVDADGAYHGTVSADLNPGSYALDITASGPWTIAVTQPRNQQDFHLPYVFNNGQGDALIGPFNVDGPYRITSTDRGRAALVVQLLNATGQSQDSPISETGYHSGSVVESDVTPGSYYLQVNADGAWSITVSSL